MKVFALMMACLVLALSFLPCADAALINKGDEIKTEVAKQGEAQGPEHSDDCSPFCHCSCCAGFSINHSTTSISLSALMTDNHYSSYLSDCPIEISLPIWQPPKI